MKPEDTLITLNYSTGENAIKEIIIVDASGNVFIDWEGVEDMAKIAPKDEQTISSGIVRALIAVRDRTWKPIKGSLQ